MVQQERTHRPVALVTGAASGIGAACARLIMADSDTELVVVDRDEEGLHVLVATLPRPQDVLAITLDVTDEAAWARATVSIKDRFGRWNGLWPVPASPSVLRSRTRAWKTGAASLRSTSTVSF
jgi:NADP-dependent 3-hydroxy acid dehydrogenase YdfG